MELSVKEIVKACGGKLISGDESVVINGISTDTRTIKEGMLFIPLRGESFDGHKFIDKAIESGATAVITEEDKSYGVPAVKVEDTRLAMGQIAGYYKAKLNIPVVAITGSVGKTTTKDIVASVLAQHFNVYKTQGNLNNDIGVPLTIFSLEKEHTAAVIEMGMNHFGEIRYLTNIVQPDIAVITNVGVSHIENLGSREGILKAKCEIFEGLKKGGKAIVNGDNDMLATLSDSYDGFKLTKFGTDSSFDIYADNIVEKGLDGIDCTIHYGSEVFDVSIHIPGKHMVSNALAAAAAGFALGMSAEEIKAGIESFEPTKMRMDIIKSNGLTIINDVYNSNPVSAMAAVDVLASASGKKCAVLGDMFELGEFAPKLHYDLGKYTAEKNIDEIVCIGEISKNMYEGARSVREGNVHYFATQEEFFESLDDIINGEMTVLVKASRGMKFEKTTDKLRGE
jgi:UDP-N-acetylmuramoyl-tripeptide--D-alanyl-D-alanine ligase